MSKELSLLERFENKMTTGLKHWIGNGDADVAEFHIQQAKHWLKEYKAILYKYEKLNEMEGNVSREEWNNNAESLEKEFGRVLSLKPLFFKIIENVVNCNIIPEEMY
jgi:intein/homing endonuclease